MQGLVTNTNLILSTTQNQNVQLQNMATQQQTILDTVQQNGPPQPGHPLFQHYQSQQGGAATVQGTNLQDRLAAASGDGGFHTPGRMAADEPNLNSDGVDLLQTPSVADTNTMHHHQEGNDAPDLADENVSRNEFAAKLSSQRGHPQGGTFAAAAIQKDMSPKLTPPSPTGDAALAAALHVEINGGERLQFGGETPEAKKPVDGDDLEDRKPSARKSSEKKKRCKAAAAGEAQGVGKLTVSVALAGVLPMSVYVGC